MAQITVILLYFLLFLQITLITCSKDLYCDTYNPCLNGQCCSSDGLCGTTKLFCSDGCVSNCFQCPKNITSIRFVDDCRSNDDCMRTGRGTSCCQYCKGEDDCYLYCRGNGTNGDIKSGKEPDCVLKTNNRTDQRFELISGQSNYNLTSKSYEFQFLMLKSNCRVDICYSNASCATIRQNVEFKDKLKQLKKISCQCEIQQQIQCSSQSGKQTVRFRIGRVPDRINSFRIIAGFFTFLFKDDSIQLEKSKKYEIQSKRLKILVKSEFLHFNASGKSIWISYYALNLRNLSENFIKIGTGYAYERNTIYEFRTDSNATVHLIREIRDVRMDENIELIEKICNENVGDIGPVLSLESDNLSKKFIHPNKLSSKGQLLYSLTKSLDVKIGDEEAEAINYSIESDGCLLNTKLNEKASRLTDFQSCTIKLSFPFNELLMMEILPINHWNSVHDHNNSIGILEILHGECLIEWYNPLRMNEQPSMVESNFFVKSDTLWMDSEYYQAHSIVNAATSATIILQIQPKPIVEKADFTYEEVRVKALNEYRARSCNFSANQSSINTTKPVEISRTASAKFSKLNGFLFLTEDTEKAVLNVDGVFFGLIKPNVSYILFIHENNNCENVSSFFNPLNTSQNIEFAKIKSNDLGVAYMNTTIPIFNLKHKNLFSIVNRSIALYKEKSSNETFKLLDCGLILANGTLHILEKTPSVFVDLSNYERLNNTRFLNSYREVYTNNASDCLGVCQLEQKKCHSISFYNGSYKRINNCYLFDEYNSINKTQGEFTSFVRNIRKSTFSQIEKQPATTLPTTTRSTKIIWYHKYTPVLYGHTCVTNYEWKYRWRWVWDGECICPTLSSEVGKSKSLLSRHGAVSKACRDMLYKLRARNILPNNIIDQLIAQL